MKKANYDATVKALHELRAGWIRSGIRYAIVGNAINLLDNQHEALACKDAAIAEQSRQLKAALAELEQVKRERDAALNDLKIADFWGNCQFCKYVGDHDAACETNDYLCCDCQEPTCACKTCANATGWEWRGPCAENGGTEDE